MIFDLAFHSSSTSFSLKINLLNMRKYNIIKSIFLIEIKIKSSLLVIFIHI